MLPSCNCIACIPAIEVNRADHNSAHLIDTVPAASRVQIHAVPWRKLNPMETKIEAKSGRTSGRYSNYSSLRGFNAIRVGRVRSQDICSGHGITAEIAAKLVVIFVCFPWLSWLRILDRRVCVKFTLRLAPDAPNDAH